MDTPVIICLVILLFTNHFLVAIIPLLYNLLLPRNSERRVYSVPHKKEQFHREFISSLITTPIPPMIIGLSVYFGILNVDPTSETITTALITFSALFIWSEVWHYYSHSLMHHRRFMWMHRYHHYSLPPYPISCLSFSIIEKALLSLGILFPFYIASQFLPVSFYAIFAYYLFYFFINTVGHYNREFFPVGFARTFFGKMMTTSTYHVMHHGRFKGHFGLMTTFLDRLHGTYWDDYPDVLDRAASGKPLATFREEID